MRTGMLFAVVLGLAACGEVKGMDVDGGGIADAPPTGDFGVAVSPTTLSLPIASSMDVTVMVSRGDGIGDIELTATTPANLSATFASPTLAADASTTTLSVTAIGGMAAATGDITITATSGGISHTATLSITTTTITVNGTVRGGRANVTVVLVGKPAITTAAGGAFSFTDVTPPYDLYVLGNEGTSSSPIPSVFYYDDLTRPDPIVTGPTVTSGITSVGRSAPLSGNFAGGAGSAYVAAWSTGGFTNTIDSETNFSFTARWGGGTTVTGNLHGVAYSRKASGAPNAFTYGRTADTMLTASTAATLPIVLQGGITTVPITGTITPPPGYASTLTMHQQFGTASAPLWTTTVTTVVDANAPVLPLAGTANIHVTADLGNATSSFVYPVSAATDVTFAMPLAATITAPADAALGVTATTALTWDAPAGMIHRVILRGTSVRYVVYTAKNTTTIPTIPTLPLPANADFTWAITGYGPHASIDEAAATDELESVSTSDFVGPPHAVTSSLSRTFKTP